jgi:isoleucyl-tRNA synthetase
VGAREHTLSAQDLLVTMRAPDGYSVEREGTHAVALDLTIDDDLLSEGRSREIVHIVQNARKTAGLQIEDRIELALAGAPELVEAARAHSDHIAGETLAVRLDVGDGAAGDLASMDFSEQTEIDGLALQLALSRASNVRSA